MTGRPDVVPDDSGARVQATGPLRHLCPHVEEEDHGRVTITWTCAGSTLELHSLAGYLEGFAGERISHEALTRAIRDDLGQLYGIGDVEVASGWETAGLAVRVTAP